MTAPADPIEPEPTRLERLRELVAGADPTELEAFEAEVLAARPPKDRRDRHREILEGASRDELLALKAELDARATEALEARQLALELQISSAAHALRDLLRQYRADVGRPLAYTVTGDEVRLLGEPPQ